MNNKNESTFLLTTLMNLDKLNLSKADRIVQKSSDF